jgi:hypothetical protein
MSGCGAQAPRPRDAGRAATLVFCGRSPSFFFFFHIPFFLFFGRHMPRSTRPAAPAEDAFGDPLSEESFAFAQALGDAVCALPGAWTADLCAQGGQPAAFDLALARASLVERARLAADLYALTQDGGSVMLRRQREARSGAPGQDVFGAFVQGGRLAGDGLARLWAMTAAQLGACALSSRPNARLDPDWTLLDFSDLLDPALARTLRVQAFPG